MGLTEGVGMGSASRTRPITLGVVDFRNDINLLNKVAVCILLHNSDDNLVRKYTIMCS